MIVSVFRNPIQRAGDFADPFVLRHDGRYYLYCTNPDVRCWSSADLMSWQLEGPTIDDNTFPGLVPFAPEVVYADGAFYMYTSPSGHGHVVLRSESPTGPFRPISGNVGHAIDGNVFIDDDGRWYFYWAGDDGVWGCELSSPTEFGEPVFTGIHMNGWTEGPFVSKRDGTYYMTLTGNHYLSSGYRIDAAWSLHPLRGYRPDPLNPIVLSTQGPMVGLGHSSSVTGPDLVSTWIVYHNLNPDASRDLDLDRQVWNRRSLQVLGPTTSAPVPAQAGAVCDWTQLATAGWQVTAGDLTAADDAAILSGPQALAVWTAPPLGPVFTAELNLTAAPGDIRYGVTLGASLVLRADRETGTLSALRPTGDEVIVSSTLPATFDHDALHCWRLVAENGVLHVILDGRAQFSVAAESVAGWQVGVFATIGPLRIGHVATTPAVASSADRVAPKPVPGRFWAALGECNDPLLVVPEDGGYDAVRLRPGGEVEYILHTQVEGAQRVYLAGDFSDGDVIVLDLNGREQELRGPSQLLSAPADLARDGSRLTLRGVEGSPLVALVTVAAAPRSQGTIFENEHIAGTGKRMLDEGTWDDLTVTATMSVTFDNPDAHADLLVRASQLSEGGEGADTRLGFDFLLGYSLQLHRDRVVFARHDYNERVLGTHLVVIDPDLLHQVTLQAWGGRFSVSLNGEHLFHIDDSLPHAVGQVGMRTSNAHLHLEVLELTAGGAG